MKYTIIKTQIAVKLRKLYIIIQFQNSLMLYS
jgi:hypothetical protein